MLGGLTVVFPGEATTGAGAGGAAQGAPAPLSTKRVTFTPSARSGVPAGGSVRAMGRLPAGVSVQVTGP